MSTGTAEMPSATQADIATETPAIRDEVPQADPLSDVGRHARDERSMGQRPLTPCAGRSVWTVRPAAAFPCRFTADAVHATARALTPCRKGHLTPRLTRGASPTNRSLLTGAPAPTGRSRPLEWCLILSPRDLGLTLCGDGGDGHLLVDQVLVGDLGESALGESVEAEVAALLGPFIVLLGKDRADQPDQGGAVGEDALHIGAAADLPVQPLLGVVGPDLPPGRFGEGGERQDVGPGRIQMRRHSR